MTLFHEIDDHRVALLDGGKLLWEHTTRTPFVTELGHTVTRHTVASNDGATWEVVSLDPLTLTPSLNCGGCGRHGFVTDGHWVPVE